jgi:soluble lytic murein transglycosylase
MRTRMALMADDRNAPFMVTQVDSKLAKDPGLLHARMMWRARKDDDDGVRELLLEAPDNVPFAEKWWKQRERQVRGAIDENQYSLAEKLLAKHGQTEGQGYAEALWLQGWVKLEFLDRPQEAYTHFYAMFNAVKYPVSKARAAYWAARAAAKSNDKEAAKSWYTTATAYPSTFYGQLASVVLYGSAPLRLPADPAIGADSKERFASGELVRAIKLCMELGREELATVFSNHIIDNADTPDEMAQAAALMRRLHSDVLGVRSAKRALQQNTILLETGYPRPNLPSGLAVEAPLALAITRQESEFDTKARSKANAIGLMQLLPATAKETARKHNIPYSGEATLLSSSSNMRLGSAYLGRLIERFDGSYVKAIAAYNAGPGRVRQWEDIYGNPGNTPEEVINWIEKIPFSETRNYVQRVLENLQVYRHLTVPAGKTPTLLIEQDLLR